MADRPLSAVSIDSLALAANIPLPIDDAWSLHEPRPPFLANVSVAESPRESYLQSTPFGSGTLLPVTKDEDYTEEGKDDPAPPLSPKSKRRPLLLLLVGLVALIVLVLAIMLPVYFTVIKPQKTGSSQSTSHTGGNGTPTNSTGGGGGGPSPTPTPPSSTDAITGGDGSTVKASDGSTFTYNNKLGGICEFIFS